LRRPVARKDRRRHELDLADRDQALRAEINALGCDYLDARSRAARSGERRDATIMVGGPQAAFERVRPCFALMGKNITLVAATATARPAKSPTRSSWRSPSRPWRALLFASKAGADPAKVREALMGGFAASGYSRSTGAHDQTQFQPRLPHRAAPEDLGLALEGARALDSRCPTPDSAADVLGLRRAGRRALGSFGLVRALEMLGNARSGSGVNWRGSIGPMGEARRLACLMRLQPGDESGFVYISSFRKVAHSALSGMTRKPDAGTSRLFGSGHAGIGNKCVSLLWKVADDATFHNREID